MELMNVLKNRRAVREYISAALTRDVIERLVAAAILAPSAMNLQPWSFAAVLDPERIDSMAERAKRWMLENPELAGFSDDASKMLRQPGFDMFYHAPALLIVMARSHVTQAVEDCCLAAQNLMLAARDEGIGSCWIGFSRPWLNLPSTKQELGVPEGCEMVAPIVLGYPKAWPETHGRKPADIFWL
jgi:nitroreductase